MKEFIQKIIIYVLIFSLIKSLVSNEKYQKYIRFFGGFCLVLLCIMPVFSMGKEHNWFEILQEKFLQMDISDVEEKFRYSEAEFQEMLEKEYQEALQKEVLFLAKDADHEIESASVTLKKKKDGYVIGEISCQKKKKETTEIAIQSIQMESEESPAMEDTSKEAEKVKNILCERFVVGKEQVHVWK